MGTADANLENTTVQTHKTIHTPLGEVTLVNRDGKLAALYLADHARMPDPATLGEATDTGFDEAERQLAEYFAGTRISFELDTDPQGTEFQKRVWTLLAQIPHGHTTTYAQLAERLGSKALVRAVGAANARNPLCIIVPCHRVLGSDGSLTGYAGGLDAKRALLALEAAR